MEDQITQYYNILCVICSNALICYKAKQIWWKVEYLNTTQSLYMVCLYDVCTNKCYTIKSCKYKSINIIYLSIHPSL